LEADSKVLDITFGDIRKQLVMDVYIRDAYITVLGRSRVAPSLRWSLWLIYMDRTGRPIASEPM
jgi:hypothetical protein